jgi:hypothetical protein
MRDIRVFVLIEEDGELYEYARNREWFTTVAGLEEAPAQPFLGLVGFEPGRIEAAALIERQQRVATRKHRLRVSAFIWFEALSTAELRDAMPASVRRFLGEGLQSKGTGSRAVETLRGLRPDVDSEIAALEARLKRPPSRRRAGAATLVMEKDAVGVALGMAGMDRRPISEWIEPEEDGPAAHFLAHLPRASLREDQIINHDVGVFGDWEVVRRSAVGAVDFEQDGRRLTVINVNRLAPEESLGVDLIYYNRAYDAFVFVQYKRMRPETVNGVEQAVYRPDSDHSKQIAAMRGIGVGGDTSTPGQFRLDARGCYFKLCAPETLDPYTTKLLKGMYLPLDLFELLMDSGGMAGTRGGIAFSYENVERRFDNTQFVKLVEAAWIGSHGDVTERLRPAVEFMIETGHSVLLATEMDHEGSPVWGEST